MSNQDIVPKRMIITGATGFIGRHLTDYYVRLGWEVIGTHHAAPPAGNASGWAHWDIHDAPPAALAQADVVVHLACAAIAQQTSPSEEARSIDVQATQALHTLWHASHPETAPQQKFIFMSSRASHPKAANQYGRIKHHCEAVLDRAGDVILRPGVVVGEGSRGVYNTLRQIVTRLPIVPVPASASRFHPTLLGDLTQAIRDLIDTPTEQGVVALALGAESGLTLKHFLEFICERENLKCPLLLEVDARLPIALLTWIGKVAPKMRYLEERFRGLLPPTP